MKSACRSLVILGLCALAAAAHSQSVVYANDFSSDGHGFSDVATVTAPSGESFLADNGNGSGNGTNTLTLSGLAAHDLVTVSFDIYVINSWNGGGPGGGSTLQNPDAFTVTANGATLLFTSFANNVGDTQAYSPATPNGLQDAMGNYYQNAPRSGAFDGNHLGFGMGDFGDATYRFSYTFMDTSSFLQLAFTSLQNQNPGNEGWGLDNMAVSIAPTPVPEPAPLAVFGLGALAFVRRRRRA